MLEAIRSDRAPNLLLLNYSPDWQIRNLLLVPRYFFAEAVIEPRKPLRDTARRARWIGCNILFAEISSLGKIKMVDNVMECPPQQVRSDFRHVRLERKLIDGLLLHLQLGDLDAGIQRRIVESAFAAGVQVQYTSHLHAPRFDGLQLIEPDTVRV